MTNLIMADDHVTHREIHTHNYERDRLNLRRIKNITFAYPKVSLKREKSKNERLLHISKNQVI